MGVGAILSFWSNMGKLPLLMFFKDSRNVLKRDELGSEIVNIAVPATLALLADPIASLIDTAFIGRIGAVELASVGVSVAIFNQISRITMFPLVSITTSFVAEEEATSKPSTEAEQDANPERESDVNQELVPLTGNGNVKKSQPDGNSKKHVPSASSALVIGSMLGIFQTLFLIFAAKPLLGYMGVNSESPMLNIAQQYLTLRSLGAPAILLSLAAQGVFRGLKDTKTPLYAIIIGDSMNVILDPILMFVLRLGVKGAGIAHVVSQYLIFLILLWRLAGKIELCPPNFKELQFSRFLKSGEWFTYGFQLLIKVISTTSCVTVAASLAARQGPNSMAAFQVCLQIWLATSLLADGLAVAGQAILASSFAKKDYEKIVATASRVLQFIAVTQPINTLAFVFDGVNYGASDFAYSAYSMVLVAVVSIFCLFILSSSSGYIGIWIALTIFMNLRVFAGLLRVGTGTGPWRFLRN
ncbi:protein DETOXIFICATION 42-like [Gossypium australe]|uniref:Protein DETOXIFICATION n=1 Tax=Gossypium australe TaxID=47621 RepID=A0A5B6V845_9ROSI|nr:protein DETOXIFICATION 42-like [Gossypium australe]